MKAPNSQAISQFSINLLRKIITSDISIPPKKQIKQNNEKDLYKGLLELFLNTQNFEKTKETIIPEQQPNIEANNIFLKIKYKDLKERKLTLDAITPDKKNLNNCLLFFLKNLYKFKTFQFYII